MQKARMELCAKCQSPFEFKKFTFQKYILQLYSGQKLGVLRSSKANDKTVRKMGDSMLFLKVCLLWSYSVEKKQGVLCSTKGKDKDGCKMSESNVICLRLCLYNLYLSLKNLK